MNDIARSVLTGLRGLLLRFVLPLVGLGLTLWAAEVVLQSLGFHQDVVKLLRLAVIPLYLLIAMVAMRKKN